MEKLEHELWIVQAVNAAFGPAARAMLRALGRPVPATGDVIPDYLVMVGARRRRVDDPLPADPPRT